MTGINRIVVVALCVGLFVLQSGACAQNPIGNPSFEESASVTDELVYLQGTTIVPLAHGSVIPSSVVVRNLAGTVTYVRNVDYTVHVGNSIKRVEGGAIPNPSTVKVSYSYVIWQDWTPYSYSIPGGNPGNPLIGAPGADGTFDVLIPTPPSAPNGSAVCGAQSWGNSVNGGVYQTFTWWGGSAIISVTARAFSVDYSLQPYDNGCRVRMGLVPFATTNRSDVTSWVTFPWGDAWHTRSISVPGPGTYTLFIESYQPNPLQKYIMSTLWDNVTWTELPPIQVTSGPIAVVPGNPDLPDSTVKIEWTTNVPCTSRVEYGFDQGYGLMVEDQNLVTQHSVLLTNLNNSSTYHYRASSSAPGYSSWVSDDRTFKTPIQFYDITTNPSPDGMSTIVIWKTDVPTTSRVEYGLTTSYGQSTPEDPVLKTEHEVAITGLAEDTDYHFRVWGTNNPLYRPACSGDKVFHTLPNPSPFLKNAGFEEGYGGQSHSLYPWVKYSVAIDASGFHPIDGLIGPYPMGGTDFWFAGIQAFEGSYFVGAAANYEYKNGGVFQRVFVSPGQPYTLSARYVTYRVGGTQRDTRFRLGLDPDGGINPLASSVRWRSVASPTNDSQWHTDAITVTAGPNGVITAFLDIKQQWPLQWHVVAVDDAKLGPPIPMTIGQLKSASQGLGAILQNKIVTYVDMEPVTVDDKGYVKAYIQEDDGSAGIAVLFDSNIPDQPQTGNRVTVTGSVLVQGMEAMFLAYDWTVDPNYYDLPKPVALCHRAIGGSTPVQPAVRPGGGVCNVGLRMRVFGRVTWTNTSDPFSDAEAFIDDGSKIPNGQTPSGSNAVPGIMVRLPANGYQGIAVGDYIAATGVLGVRYVDPNGWPNTGDEYYTYVVSVGSPEDWNVISSLPQ